MAHLAWKGASRFSGVSMLRDREKMLVPSSDPKSSKKMSLITGRGVEIKDLGQRESDKNKRNRLDKEREDARNGVIPTPERVKASGRKYTKDDRKKAVQYIFGGKELEEKKKEKEQEEFSEDEEDDK